MSQSAIPSVIAQGSGAKSQKCAKVVILVSYSLRAREGVGIGLSPPQSILSVYMAQFTRRLSN